MSTLTATKLELARKYGISAKTPNKWLAAIPELVLTQNGRILTPKQVKLIHEDLAEP